MRRRGAHGGGTRGSRARSVNVRAHSRRRTTTWVAAATHGVGRGSRSREKGWCDATAPRPWRRGDAQHGRRRSWRRLRGAAVAERGQLETVVVAGHGQDTGRGGGRRRGGREAGQRRGLGLVMDPMVAMFCTDLKYWKVGKLNSSKRCIGNPAKPSHR